MSETEVVFKARCCSCSPATGWAQLLISQVISHAMFIQIKWIRRTDSAVLGTCFRLTATLCAKQMPLWSQHFSFDTDFFVVVVPLISCLTHSLIYYSIIHSFLWASADTAIRTNTCAKSGSCLQPVAAHSDRLSLSMYLWPSKGVWVLVSRWIQSVIWRCRCLCHHVTSNHVSKSAEDHGNCILRHQDILVLFTLMNFTQSANMEHNYFI